MFRESRIIYPVKTKTTRPANSRRVLALAAVAAFFALAAALWYVSGLSALAVNNIEVAGADNIPKEEIRQAIEVSIAGRWWSLVPKNNYFAVSAGRTEENIRVKFPELAAVNADKIFPHGLRISASGRKLWGVYCMRPALSAPAAPCAYLDAGGTAYEELLRYNGWLLPVIYGSSVVKPGEIAVPPAMLEFFNQAKTELESLNGYALSFSFSTTTPDEVRLDLAEGFSLRITPSRPISEWLGVLKTVLEKDIGARRAELEYVDLRFGAKVFYKFR
ncbi:MAG: FtsQ-type POTRA domain-containing protein [Candidatus Sungbacteria bacterium]|uniref:FtsQ-type POTRA domain-containing protein n=1 Tax=Candidatus Sungiibacteriota bacterium TaxID=2750080 RepID=A0A932YYA5_9BACT|nr:FtsQ-type POTRA domain-containing protein [Candidatus Sungbacteria bacterium]